MKKIAVLSTTKSLTRVTKTQGQSFTFNNNQQNFNKEATQV